MTCNVLTPGHIKCLEELSRRGPVIVSLLTKKALRGYKKEAQPFEDRKFVLETVARAIGNVTVVPQENLNPSDNIQKYGATALASGDGFEIEEELAATAHNIELINIRLEGESEKRYSSSKILDDSK